MKKIFIGFLLLYSSLFSIAQTEKEVKFNTENKSWEETNESLVSLNPKNNNVIKVNGCTNFILEIKDKNNQTLGPHKDKPSPINLSKILDTKTFDRGKPYTLFCTCNDNNSTSMAKYPIFNQASSVAVKDGQKIEINCEDCNTDVINKILKESCKAERRPENNFGEDTSTYDKNKIVYIYDFNKDINKRGFYKIVRVENDVLKIKKEIKNIEYEIKELNHTSEITPKQAEETAAKDTSALPDKVDEEKKNNTDTTKPAEEKVAKDTLAVTGKVDEEKKKNTNTPKPKNEQNKVSTKSDSENTTSDNKKLKELKEELEKQKSNLKKYNHQAEMNREPIYSLKTEPVNFSKEVLRSNNHIQFKVVNVNRFLYDVSIEDSLVKFDSQPSALFSQLFLGDSNLLGGILSTFSKGVTGTTVKASNAVSGKDTVKKGAEVKNLLLCKIKCFTENFIAINAKMLEAYSPCTDFPCCQNFIPAYTQLAKDLISIKIDSATVQQTIIKDLNDELKTKKEELAACNQKKEKLVNWQNKITQIKAKPKPSLSTTDEEDLAKNEKEEAKLKAELCSEDEIKSIKSKINELENELKLNNAINELQKKLPTEAQLRKNIVFIQHMIDQNQTHMFERVTLNGNRLDLKLNIQSKDSITKYFSIPSYKNKAIPIEIPIIGKAFVSFSSGSFISLGKSLQNKIYDWQPIPNNNNIIDTGSAKYKLTESGFSLPVMGFAALANIEWKCKRAFGYGASVGVGLTIEKEPRYAYLLGGSIFLGDIRQFVVTAGVAAMHVNKLKNNLQAVYEQGVLYSTSPAKESIEYYKELKPGFFISFTYTPFK